MIHCKLAKSLLNAYFFTFNSLFSALFYRKLSELVHSVSFLMELHCGLEIAVGNLQTVVWFGDQKWVLQFADREISILNIMIIHLLWNFKLQISWYKFWCVMTTLLSWEWAGLADAWSSCHIFILHLLTYICGRLYLLEF